MTFVDDYSRMRWVYLLKTKSEAFQTFKNFHAWIENQAQAHIGTFQFDNGKEYISNEFEYYLSKNGITHQTSIPYNPQQNGVAKRMNRTLMNMERSMMFFKNVKLMFWGDVVVCTTYLRNRSPYHALEDNTPHEMWFGHLPLVRNLRAFGSTCYDLIPKEKRNKLGARSGRCIFLGYPDTSKAYRLYDEVNKIFFCFHRCHFFLN